MGVARVWFLWSLAALMVATEIVLTLASSLVMGESPWRYLPGILMMAVLTATPYFAVAATTIAYSPRYSATFWVLAMGMLLVAEASLFYRGAEMWIAMDAWHARMNGGHYGNCGPPARLLILFLDYCGTGLVLCSAGTVLLAQLMWFGAIRFNGVRR